MVDTRTDYSPDEVAAARSVMLELVRLLGEYREDMVIVGGWVPELLLPAAQPKHIGSTDVDVALDHRRITEAGYQTIRGHLLRHGYVEGKQPFIFLREVQVGGRSITVRVDFLAGEYGGAGRGHRTQSVQDMAARKARGCDLALEMNTRVRIGGGLPGGGLDSADVRVASIVPFIAMKGMALHDRLKAKMPGTSTSASSTTPGDSMHWSRSFVRICSTGSSWRGLPRSEKSSSHPTMSGQSPWRTSRNLQTKRPETCCSETPSNEWAICSHT